MPRESAFSKVGSNPSGQRSTPRKGVSQSLPQAPRRITRSNYKSGDIVYPGGPGSFRSKPTPTPRATSLVQDYTVLPSVEIASSRPKTASETGTTGGSAGTDFAEDSTSATEDDLEAFYKRLGYLPPLDDATVEALEFLQLSNPDMDTDAGRISASKKLKDFMKGLQEFRNVSVTASEPGTDDVDKLINRSTIAAAKEKKAVTDYRDELWTHDLKKCSHDHSEKIFQRTLLMAMIDRYRLIYNAGSAGSAQKPLLDFGVENVWNCPPMPTEAAKKSVKLLTRPMPDLAVAFQRESLFPTNPNWKVFPIATQKIICYEGTGLQDTNRAFHFLTIEAKRQYTSVDDPVAVCQSLNNASQALHNIYEFFREADTGVDNRGNDKENGNQFRDIFFNKVRFFSVVATTSAMKIRIHRACRLDPGQEPIVQGYPLQFKFADYVTVYTGGTLQRQMVVEELAKILLGYGVGQLAGHLQEAIEAVHRKFRDHRNINDVDFPREDDFYSHGLYARLMNLASKEKRATASKRNTEQTETRPQTPRDTSTTEQDETRSETPRANAGNSQQVADQSQSFGSGLHISVDSNFTSSDQLEISQPGPSRGAAAPQQEDSATRRGKEKKRKLMR